MLKIGICVEEKIFERHIIKLIRGMLPEFDGLEFESIQVDALLNKNGEMFADYPVFVIDEHLFREKGTETAWYLERIRPDASVILVEGDKEQTVSGVRYHVFAYQMKRLKQRELTSVIVERLKAATETPRCITIRYDGDEIQIPIKDIMYAESRNRHIVMHTVMGEYEYGEKMYILEDILEADGFVRCHQSFIVSKRYVTDINSEGIWLEQECIPVGRTYRDKVMKALCDVTDAVRDGVEIHGNMDIVLEGRNTVRDGEAVYDKKTEKQGVLVGVKGLYEGAEFHFRPEERIIIGRSEKAADIVLNLPLASRLHCVIIFHEEDSSYEVMDFSKNGTYLRDKKRLAPDTSYMLKPGTEISIGDSDNVYRLG